MDSSTSRIEDAIALRIRHPHAPFGAALEVRWYSDTRVSGLSRALSQFLGISGNPQLGVPSFQARLARSALASDCQLTRGMLVEIGARDSLPELPALDTADDLRLIHEGGPQAGFAWPFHAERTRFLLALAADSQQLQLLPDNAEEFAIEVARAQADTLLVSCVDADVSIRVDGADAGASAEIHVGSLVELVRASAAASAREGGADADVSVLSWRLYSGREHEAMRRVTHTVPYRVSAPDSVPIDAQPSTFPIGSSPSDRPPKLDVTEIALQVAPFAAIALVLLVAGLGSPIYGLVLLLYPAFQIFQRLRQHRSAVEDHQQEWARWRKETSSQLSSLRARAEAEATYLRGLEPPTTRLTQAASRRERGLWDRRPDSDWFLRTAVGVGTYQTPSRAVISGPLVDGDLEDWRSHAESVRLVAEVPALGDIAGRNLALIGPVARLHRLANEVLVRIALTHSPASLAMALFLPTHAQRLEDFEWLRWLPHLSVPTPAFTGARIRRGGEDCTDAVRSAKDTVNDSSASEQHLLLVVHEACGVRVEALRELVSRADGRIHVLWFGAAVARAPEFVRERLRLTTSERIAELKPRANPSVRPLDATAVDFEEVAAALAPLTDEIETVVSASVPTRVELGSVIDVGRGEATEQILRAWRDASSSSSLVGAIGLTSAGLFELDLVAEGPHMLLAGTTGSGKSELLRTLLTSLAMRYPPSDLAMVLVDFKGGAALHEFEGIPHVVGHVSNLEPYDVERTVAFLDAEINRRQTRLRELQGEYASHRARSPRDQLPRLVIAIDEFQGFMGARGRHLDAILNIAARGRSLGVHLLLSTQRPRGAVDPSIIANVNARLCLRTLDEADSISVIDAPNAAWILRTLPGRCFARMEAGSLIEFQAAFTGSRELAVREQTAGVAVTSFHSVQASTTPANEPDSAPDAAQTDIAFLLDHVKRAAHPVPKLTHRSQPRLEESLTARDPEPPPALDGQVPRSVVAIGLRDEPERQEQNVEQVDLRHGGVLFEGGTQLGKTTALASIGRQLLERDPRAGLVLLDGGDGRLRSDLDGEAVAAVSVDSPADITHIVDQLLSSARVTDAEPVLALIDRLDELQRAFRTTTRLASLVRLLATGPARGVYVAASCDPRLELDPSLRAAFPYRLALVPHKRGMAQTREEQLIKLYLPPVRRTDRTEPSAPRDSRFGYPSPTTIARLPAQAPPATVRIGIDEITHEPLGVTVGSGFLIAGVPRSGRSAALLTVGRGLAEFLNDRHPSAGPIPYLGPEGATPPFEWLRDLRPQLLDLREDLNGRTRFLQELWASEPRLVLIDGVDDLPALLPAAPEGALALAHDFAALLTRLGVRVVATSELSGRSPLTMPGDLPMLHMSRRNFAVLKPPSSEMVQSLGVFHGATFYDELVRPRDDRDYEPGEGSLVTPRGSHQLRVLADTDVLNALRDLRARVRDW